MASRRQAREFALQALFEADLRGADVEAALSDLWAAAMDGEGIEGGKAPEADEIQFAERLCRGVKERQEEIDLLIERCSTNWRLPRMPVVDRNILRLASFELLGCDDIPPNVSINEAIELAKRFGAQDSRAFVNGIVDRLARQVGRIPGKS
ncbi:MAG: transcription antitermination factor NusB [Myxococcales bacterium]|nr:transcription antitermination factor NusB [Myxococcales bacterium]